jgi:phosphopantothenoylcysteine decarboxylase/phosphopantothenate--cysteine ligase
LQWSYAPAVQANMDRLKSWGLHVIGPAEGFLACRTIGPGRMAEPETIVAYVAERLRAKPPKKSGS